MNTTQHIAVYEFPKPKKWPYVLGGFVAGVASTIGAAFFIDAQSNADSSSAKEVDVPKNHELEVEDNTLETKTVSSAEKNAGNKEPE